MAAGFSLGGLLGGGDDLDIYGDLLTDKQKAAIRSREMTQGLLRMSGAFAEAAKPSLLPTGGIGSALGKGAAALAGGEGADKALQGLLTGEKIRQAQQERELYKRFGPAIDKIAWKLIGGQTVLAPPGQPPAPGAQPVTPVPTTGPGGAPADPDNAGLTGVPGGVPGGGDFPGATAAPGAAWPAPTPRAALPRHMTSGRAGAGMPPQNGFVVDPYDPRFGTMITGAPPGPGAGLSGGGVLPQIASLYEGGGTGSPDPFGAGEDGGLLLDPERRVDVRPLSGQAAPAGGNWERDKQLIRKYESGGRNIEQGVVGPQGGYNPSVGRVTGPSSASGYYQMIDPTWRHAAEMVGIDTKQYPRAIDAPEPLQDKAAEALYREQGLNPWAPYNSRLAAATGYSGGGNGRVDVRPLSGEAVPAGAAAPAGAPSGKIPGTDVSPQELAALSMMLKMSGMKGSPFDALLETYYKSPEYLGTAKAAQTAADLETRTRLEPKLQNEILLGTMASKIELKKKEELINRESKQIEQDNDLANKIKLQLFNDGLAMEKMPDGSYKVIPLTEVQRTRAENARQLEAGKEGEKLVDVVVTLPGESRPTQMQMPIRTYKDILAGKPVPELNIPAMSGIKLGKPVYNPTETALGPVEAKAIFENHQLASDAATTIETNKEARRLLDAGAITGFGADKVTALTKLGNALGVTGRNSQELVANTESYMATTAANVGRMIKQFGAGTGLSDADREYAAQMAAGKITLDETSIRKILDINDRASLNIINRHNQRVSKIAPGATMTDLNVPAPEPYKPPEKPTAATTAPANAPTATGPRGEKLILRDGQWVPR